jgi:hypothetical protein
MKKLFTTFMLIPILLFGQNDIIKNIDLTKNNIYAEGHVGLFTKFALNYERQISSGEKVSWYGRLGGGWGADFSYGIFAETSAWGGLGTITMLTGKKNSHFELNAGAFFSPKGEVSLGFAMGDSNTDGVFIFPIFNIGYRYQKPSGGFIFRANVGAISTGLSVGYAF